MPPHLIPYAYFCMALTTAIGGVLMVLLLIGLVQMAIDRYVRLRQIMPYFIKAMELQNEERRRDRP